MKNRSAQKSQAEIGMIGLGEMGRNLALNMADHGFSVAGYDRDAARIRAFCHAGADRGIFCADTIGALTALLREPRAVMLLVPAGAPVDDVIGQLLPLLKPGDLVMDGGNSHFRDTDRRGGTLSAKGILYLGVGISGGGEGARRGPSLMPGGPAEAYERVRPVLEAVAARVNDQPCVAWMGSGSAGHYVKMVHNGIEYALMQLIAETYDLLRRGLGLSNDQLHRVYDGWNRTGLESYLLEITARIFLKRDERTGGRLIDYILDEAEQKGTGKWTSQEAMDLGVPVPNLDAAVWMRELSGWKRAGRNSVPPPGDPVHRIGGDPEQFQASLKRAYHSAAALSYLQGFEVLREASDRYGYRLNLREIVRIWRGGCIIRSALLDRLFAGFEERSRFPDLLADSPLGREAVREGSGLHGLICAAAEAGIPVPGFTASLAYLDAQRSPRLPANLIQAQRDYFGAHGYKRIDTEGNFHTDWED